MKDLKEPTAPVTVYLPIGTLAAIANLAAKEDRTRHYMLKKLILLGMAAHTEEKQSD